jgi:hypothetical protein
MNALRAARCAVAVLLCLGAVAAAAAAQSPCLPVADSLVNSGWTHYRANDMDAAGSAFAAARVSCPANLGALIGTGYVALRRGDVAAAGSRFAEAVRRDSAAVDALFGMGLLAWRRDEPDTARVWFGRVTAIVPSHAEANAYLAQLGRAPQRPPLQLPDTVVLQARTNGDRFEVPSGTGWTSFYVKGVILGAALPGRFPSEFPDSATYAAWIGQMVEMGTNAVRVYTIHPPWFYQALLQYNTEHPAAPLRLIHGVWTELPPGHDFADPEWNGEFLAEARRVVDLLHGRADLPRRPGHAAGFYTADVSPWTLAYLIGREWEPYAVAAFDSANPGRRAWSGRYLRVDGGTATDVWLTQVCDSMIAYETASYRHQRPVAYTNWPTLDPLHHITEASVAEEMALRRSAGEQREAPIREYDNDLVAIDPSLVHPTAAFGAGFFASYHAYPYYPDFMVLGSGYADYLARLKAHHAGMPVLIAEYGVPASLGIAHVEPRGRHQGGHTEAEMATVDAEMTRLLAGSGMAGGALFAWIDEWFKKNWVVIDLEIPMERKPLWLSRMNAEEQYGVYAMQPAQRLVGDRLRERLAGWRAVPAVYPGRLRAFADEAYLHLLFEPGPGPRVDSLLIGLDVIDPGAGSFRWPGRLGEELPFGIEFLVAVTPPAARVLADQAANPFRVRRESVLRPPQRAIETSAPPPGFFTGPYEMGYNLPLLRGRRDDGRFDTLRVVTNRRRIGRDSVEYAAAGYERGALPPGPAPDGFWEVDTASGAIELRIPWNLINVADPSSRAVLSSAQSDAREFTPTLVPSLGIAVAARTSDGVWRRWPARGAAGARFTWPGWDEPRWRARRRPVFDAMREAFRTVDYRRETR